MKVYDILVTNASFCYLLREAAKKSSSLNGRAIKRGGGKGRAIIEKRTFFEL